MRLCVECGVNPVLLGGDECSDCARYSRFAEEERCATCRSGDPRKPGESLGQVCADPYHASAWE
jgi:hypothetical protein